MFSVMRTDVKNKAIIISFGHDAFIGAETQTIHGHKFGSTTVYWLLARYYGGCDLILIAPPTGPLLLCGIHRWWSIYWLALCPGKIYWQRSATDRTNCPTYRTAPNTVRANVACRQRLTVKQIFRHRPITSDAHDDKCTSLSTRCWRHA